MKFLDVEKYTPIQKSHEAYLKELMEYCKDTPRHPSYHIHPPCGLVNDPNGLAYFGGKYHVFYQWFPFGPEHGMKHWAHVISEDLVKWEWSDQMLIPDQEYEKNGCYSGNSIEADGKLYLYYTANYKTEQGKIPKQAMAVMNSDGTILKSPNNPIIDEQPEGLIGEIRDPFVFEKEGAYWMLLGGGSTDGQARLILYKSTDLENWVYQGNIELTGIDLELGYMYECPSYIEIDGKDVLFLSLMGRTPMGERFHNEFSSVYFIGELNLEDKTFHVESFDEIDKGFDFYAPQVMECGDRKILFAWFAIPDSPGIEMEDGWRHLLTLPRELKISSDGSLLMTPIEELKKLRTKVLEKTVPGASWNCNIENQPLELLLTGRYEELCFEIADKNEPLLELTLKKDNIVLKQKREDGWQIRTCSYYDDIMRKMQIYMDYSTIEVFINDGRYVFSSRIYPVGSLDFRINAAADNEDGSLKIYSLSL